MALHRPVRLMFHLALIWMAREILLFLQFLGIVSEKYPVQVSFSIHLNETPSNIYFAFPFSLFYVLKDQPLILVVILRGIKTVLEVQPYFSIRVE